MFYVMQDGADFYLFADEEGEELIRVVTAPFKVQDMNTCDADKARTWFDEYGYFKGAQEVRFIF